MIIEMQPNGQNQPTQNPGQFDSSQFDFIMNPQQPSKKSLVPLPTDPKMKLIFMVIGGGLGLILLLLLFFGIFGGGNDSADGLVEVAQQQNEIIRVSEIGSKDATTSEAKKLAALVNSAIATDRTKTIDYLGKNGKKLSSKDLSLKQDAETDSELSTAKQNGRFDEVYIQMTLDYLEKYQQNLEAVYPSLGEQGKAIIKQANENAVLIIQGTQATQ